MADYLAIFFVSPMVVTILSAVVPKEKVGIRRWSAVALMVAMGVAAAFCRYSIIRAFEQAPASLLAPYGYAEIVTATALGYVVFGDFPDRWTWVGIAVVISGGVYTSFRERRARGR